MNELNLDAEGITRNKTYDSFAHLSHLLKVGWSTDSQVIKKFLKENDLTNNDLLNIIKKLSETQSKDCCTDRSEGKVIPNNK